MLLASAVLMLVVPAGALIASPMRLVSPAAAASASPAAAVRTLRTVRASAVVMGMFTEITPLKAAMLCKMWQGLLVEVDQKVGVVPELGGSSVGIQRFGPELERYATACSNPGLAAPRPQSAGAGSAPSASHTLR